jgi:malate dehydrogenase (oxaloacetate-decarboxylating)(NADP+)
VAGRPGLQDHKHCNIFFLLLKRVVWLTIFTLVFARTDYDGPPLTKLLDIIDYVKPTALLGLSTIKASHILLYHSISYTHCWISSQSAFSQPVVERMAKINKRPIIFPLSNPVNMCEVTYDDAVKWFVLSAFFRWRWMTEFA